MNALKEVGSQPLIEQALAEFDRRWVAACETKPTAADFRGLFQGNDLHDFIELIYHEFCRLEAEGDAPEPTDFMARYAEFAPRLEKLFQVHLGLLEMGTTGKTGQGPTPEPDFPKQGDMVGPFQLGRVLGKGMMGKVFLACQTNLADRQVVLKISRSSTDTGTEWQARLNHPNIMPVLDQFPAEEQAFHVVVMPYRPGASLDQLLLVTPAARNQKNRRKNLLSRDFRPRLDPSLNGIGRSSAMLLWPDQVAEWGAQLADALHFAHQQGLIHGDIKPGNIYMDTRLSTCLLDFHLARRWEQVGHLRILSCSDPGGTLYYLSPERLGHLLGRVQGIRPTNSHFRAMDVQTAHRGDLYSLGIVLLELLTGHTPAQVQPCPTDDLAETARLLRKWREDVNFLRQWPGFRHLPGPFRSLIKKLLSPEPADRFADGAELAGALRQLKSAIKKPALPLHAVRRPKVVVATAALIALFCVSLTAILQQRADFTREVQSLWNMPNSLQVDPSETSEMRLALKLRQARTQLEPILNGTSRVFQRTSLDWLTRPALARLDADLWLAQRLEEFTSLMAARAMATKNDDDLKTTTDLLQFGIQKYNAPATWQTRYKQLTGKTALKPVSEPISTEMFPRLLDEFISSQANWEAMIKAAPKSFGLQVGYIKYLIGKNKGRDAISVLKNAVEIDPLHFDSWRLLAYLEMDQGHYQQALDYLDRALNLRPDDISALRLQAICRVQTGQHDQLLAEMSRIGEILNESPTPKPFEIGELLKTKPKPQPDDTDVFDLKTVERMNAILPNDLIIMDLLMYKYAKAGRIFDASTIIQQMEKQRPDKLEYKINHAILSFSAGRMDETYQLLMEIMEHGGMNIAIRKHAKLSIFILDVIQRIEHSDLERAEKLCKRLLTYCESAQVALGECHFILARLLLRINPTKNLDESINHLIISGQRNQEYLRIWYKMDPVFQRYHVEFDKKLADVFPELNLSESKSK